MTEVPRESVEFIPVVITVDGAAVTAGIDVALTRGSGRPSVWDPAVSLGGQVGFMTGYLEQGTHTVWARVRSTPEQPVVMAGRITIT